MEAFRYPAAWGRRPSRRTVIRNMLEHVVSVVHGPPATGKLTLVATMLIVLYHLSSLLQRELLRALLLATNNQAIDAMAMILDKAIRVESARLEHDLFDLGNGRSVEMRKGPMDRFIVVRTTLCVCNKL